MWENNTPDKGTAVARFSFYQGKDKGLARRLQASCSALWGELRTVQRNSFWLFVPASEGDTTLSESGDVLGAVSGYVRRDNLPHGQCGTLTLDHLHNRSFLEAIVEDHNWPLGGDWTGSFGAVAHSQGTTVVCNDLLGFQPVYYSLVKHGVVGGSSLIALGRSIPCEVDIVGLLQRITPPYCNYGRRTLLRGISRLLPGERMKFSDDSASPSSMFDNSLCAGVINPDIDTAARLTWNCMQQEMNMAVGIQDHIAVAMSGGWDSRVVLAGIAHRANTISCLTYGDANAYEVLIAKRCAQAVGAHHESFSIQGTYFPPRDGFKQLVMETESFNIPEWYSMISAQRERRDRGMIILLGDHCQGIDGRYMTEFASRSARRKAFVGSIVGKHEHLEAASFALFDTWKQEKIGRILRDLCSHKGKLAPALAEKCTDEQIIGESTSDLELSILRVRDNIPPFVAMFDELFNWFHKSRYTLSSQNLLLNSVYRSMSPSMSMRSLRFLSTIHPRLRLRRRLMDALARLHEYDVLAKIPSAQIPFMSARAPSAMREVTWGLRSGLDQMLIGRVMKAKDPNKRQRVLHSLDYLREYRRPEVQSTVGSWFSQTWLRGEVYVQVARERGEMSSWPLINLDLAAPANVSMILDACQEGKLL
jgi:hypothetical protein